MPVLPLGPDVVAERVTLNNGNKITTYRCPYPSEGPVETRVNGQPPTLAFMYAHFVFTWPQGSTRVDVAHGTIATSTPLWPEQSISGEWAPRTLAAFGERWALSHLARFRSRKEDEHDAQ